VDIIYLVAPKRLVYRPNRNPLIFVGIGPRYFFLIAQRYLHEWEGKNERRSVVLANLAILVIMVVANLRQVQICFKYNENTLNCSV
jgi:hypothetical protein